MSPTPSRPRRLLTRRDATLAAVAGVIAAALPGAHAQAQPQLDSPLRIVVGYAPGGATDRVARIVGDKLAARLGVPVVVMPVKNRWVWAIEGDGTAEVITK